LKRKKKKKKKKRRRNKKRKKKRKKKKKKKRRRRRRRKVMMTVTMMTKKEQENVLNSYFCVPCCESICILQVLRSVCTSDMRQYSPYPSTRCHNTEVCNTNLHNPQTQLCPLLLCRSRKEANAK
jgi:hypothetical protein